MGRLVTTAARDLSISLEEAWDMLWADLLDLTENWGDAPPLHLMVAAFLGIKPKDRTPFKPSSIDEIQRFAAAASKG